MTNLKSCTNQDLRTELQTRGFFTENLWHVHDVTGRFKCNEAKAMEVLHAALENQFTVENIFEVIAQYAMDAELEEVDR